jgi:hypothetical protein
VEFLGEAWKNQGLGLALSEKTYNQNIILKYECLFDKDIQSIKTPVSEAYHLEVDVSPDQGLLRNSFLKLGTCVGHWEFDNYNFSSMD